MKKSLSDIIVFLGSSIRFFALYMVINFAILALLMAFTLIAFHLHIKYLNSFNLFLVMAIFCFLLTRWLQFKVLLKKQIMLQYAFITYRTSGQAKWQFDPPAGGFKNFSQETRKDMGSHQE